MVSCLAEIGFSGGAQSCVPVSPAFAPTLAVRVVWLTGARMWDNRDDFSTRRRQAAVMASKSTAKTCRLKRRSD